MKIEPANKDARSKLNECEKVSGRRGDKIGTERESSGDPEGEVRSSHRGGSRGSSHSD